MHGGWRRPARVWLFAVVLAVSSAAAPATAAAMIVWGDVHAHSGLSNDAIGSVADFFLRARNVAQLDFVVLSDHDFWLTPLELAVLHGFAAASNEPGRFVAFSGVEWTRAYHLNAVFRTDDVPICAGAAGPPCDTAADFAAFYGPLVHAGAAAAHVNHPSWGVPWHEFDDSVLTNSEVWNTLWDRVDRNDKVHADDPGVGGTLWALQAGMRLGFVGASDDHQNPLFLGGSLIGTALTGCHVNVLGRDDILSALRERRCYATNGVRIGVDFDVDGVPMGGELAVPLHASVTATVDVTGTATPFEVEILRNGTVVGSEVCSTLACTVSVPIEVEDEYTFIHARVNQPDDRHAWASPVWIRGQCAQPGDCPGERIVPRFGPGCLTRWRLLPRVDSSRSGRRLRRVTCVDGDPACDFDSDPGTCTFRASLCLGVPDPPPAGCTPPDADVRYTLLRPSAAVDSMQPFAPSNRQTLLVAAAGLHNRPAGSCSPYVDVRVPLRASGTSLVRRTYTLAGYARADRLYDAEIARLICVPQARASRTRASERPGIRVSGR